MVAPERRRRRCPFGVAVFGKANDVEAVVLVDVQTVYRCDQSVMGIEAVGVQVGNDQVGIAGLQVPVG